MTDGNEPSWSGDTISFSKEKLDEKQIEMMPSKIPGKATLNVSSCSISNQSFISCSLYT